jgi:hypothetical protein
MMTPHISLRTTRQRATYRSGQGYRSGVYWVRVASQVSAIMLPAQLTTVHSDPCYPTSRWRYACHFFLAALSVALVTGLLAAPAAEARSRRKPPALPWYLLPQELGPAPVARVTQVRKTRKSKRQPAKPALAATVAVAQPPATPARVKPPLVKQPSKKPASAAVVVNAAKPAALLSNQSSTERDLGRLQLVAGALKATVTQEATETQPAAGDTVYASLVVQGSGMAEILVAAEGGTLEPLLGTRMTTGPKEIGNPAAGQVARFDLGPEGRSAITVELKSAGQERTRLRLTLSALTEAGQATAVDQTILSWQRASCAQNFYQSIKAIGSERVPLMSTALDQVLAPDATLLGQWQFGLPKASPVLTNAAAPATGRCIDQRVRTDYVTGEKTKVCRRWKGAAPSVDAANADPVDPAVTEADIIKLADVFVKSRLALKAFERKRVLRLKSTDLFNSLRNYIDQPPHPALCTGVTPMLDYYVENTEPLSMSIARIERIADAATTETRTRVVALTGQSVADMQSAATSATVTPTLISAAIAAPPEPVGHVVLKQSVVALAQYVLTPEQALTVDAQATPRLAFDQLAGLLNPVQPALVAGTLTTQVAADEMGADRSARLSAAKDALGMMEAAVILDGARERFALFRRAGYETVDAIRGAHQQNCTCAQ